MFSYGIECCITNVYVFYCHAGPQDHSRRGRAKSNYFTLRHDLAIGLIAEFQSRQHPGRRRSNEHSQ